tara:strand:+ start:129 stop:497 length:369 start_codon:yes stop_codon:yes gene_type:complete
MKLFEVLDDDNFLLYASRNYNSARCIDLNEFYDDLNRFKHINKLLTRYSTNNDLQERLLLNHTIVLFNVFGIEAASKMLWYRIKEQHWAVIKTLLVYLNYLNDHDKVDIPLDMLLVNRLREI